eukprot:6172747-Pleurochrysis_carterae.AAC.2
MALRSSCCWRSSSRQHLSTCWTRSRQAVPSFRAQPARYQQAAITADEQNDASCLLMGILHSLVFDSLQI